MDNIGIRITAKDETKSVFGDVGRGLEKMETTVTSLSGALASIGVGLSVGALVNFVKTTNDAVDALNDIKDATGSSIENISALEDVAARTGTSMATVTTSLVKLNGVLKDAKPGSGAEQSIKLLGLSIRELKELDPAEALLRTAQALNGFADDGNKARVVQELFGKSLKDVAPLLKDLAENGKLVATTTTQQAEAAEKFNKQLYNLQKNASDARRAIVSELVPALSDGAERFALAYKHAGSLLGVLAMYTRLDYSDGFKGNLEKIDQQIKALEERASRITSDSVRLGNDRAIAALKAQAAFVKDLQQQKALDGVGDTSDAVSRKYMASNKSIGDMPDDAAAKKAQQDLNRELEEQSRLMAELSGLTGSFSKDWDRLTAVYKAGKIDMQGLVTAQAALLEKQPAIKAASNETAKAWEEQSKAAAKAIAESTREYENYVKSLQQSADSTAAQVQRLQDEEQAAQIAAASNISLASAIELVVVARLREKQAAALTAGDQEAADAIKAEIENRQKLAALMQGKEIRETTAKAASDAAKQANEEWRRAAQDIEKSITDALLRGFESGKGFAENLRDTVVNMFQSLVLRPIVSAVVSPVAALLAGGAPSGAAAGQGSVGQLSAAAQLKNVYTTVTGSFTSLANGVSSVSATLGKWMLENTSGVLQKAGMQLYAKAGSIGTGASIVGGALAGYGIGSAISGKHSVFGDGKGDTAVVAGTALGAAIGSVIPVLGTALGAAVGGTIGGIVNRAFGQGPKEVNASGIQGTFAGSGFSGMSYQEWSRSGGWFSSGSSGTDYAGLDSSYSTALGKAYGAVTTQTADLAASLGLSTAQILGYTKAIRVDSSQLNDAGLTSLFESIGDELARTVVSAPFIKEGERASVALSRLSTSLSTVNSAFELLDKTAIGASLVGGDAASQLIDLLGGIESFNSTTIGYYKTYYTETERNAKTAEQLAAVFADLGVAMPDSVEAFRALVDAQDPLTESGRTAYAALMGINEAFYTVASSAEEAAQALIKTMNFASYADYAVAMAAAGGKPVPRFANGGMHFGGLRVVGEREPELEATGPARYWNGSQIAGALSGSGGTTDAQLQALCQEQRNQATQMKELTSRFVGIIARWDMDGMPEARTA